MCRIPYLVADAQEYQFVSPMQPTPEERMLLAPFRESLMGDGDVCREEGVPLEEPQRAEDEYTGLEEDQDFWWGGIDYVLRDEDGEIGNAGCILPSERFYTRWFVNGVS